MGWMIGSAWSWLVMFGLFFVSFFFHFWRKVCHSSAFFREKKFGRYLLYLSRVHKRSQVSAEPLLRLTMLREQSEAEVLLLRSVRLLMLLMMLMTLLITLMMFSDSFIFGGLVCLVRLDCFCLLCSWRPRRWDLARCVCRIGDLTCWSFVHCRKVSAAQAGHDVGPCLADRGGRRPGQGLVFDGGIK